MVARAATALLALSTVAVPLGPAAARLIHELIPDQPVERIRTLEQIREETVAPQRLNALLDTEAAWAAEPVLVRRLRELRDS